MMPAWGTETVGAPRGPSLPHSQSLSLRLPHPAPTLPDSFGLTWWPYPNFVSSTPRVSVAGVIGSSHTASSNTARAVTECLLHSSPWGRHKGTPSLGWGKQMAPLAGRCQHMGAAGVFLCHLPEEGGEAFTGLHLPGHRSPRSLRSPAPGLLCAQPAVQCLSSLGAEW